MSRESLSMIEAAVKVLSGSKASMKCQAVIDAMIAKKLWKPGEGKTPAATLSTKFLAERRKGRDSRVVQVGRGLFTVPSHAKGVKAIPAPAEQHTGRGGAKGKTAKGKVAKGKGKGKKAK